MAERLYFSDLAGATPRHKEHLSLAPKITGETPEIITVYTDCNTDI